MCVFALNLDMHGCLCDNRHACVLPASARLLLEGVVASISLLPSALFWMPLSALFTVKTKTLDHLFSNTQISLTGRIK